MEEIHSQEEGVAEKRDPAKRSDTETGGEAGPSQSQYKNGYMTKFMSQTWMSRPLWTL